jgi:hypothetical protein
LDLQKISSPYLQVWGQSKIRLGKFGEEKLLAGVSPQQTSGIQTDFAATPVCGSAHKGAHATGSTFGKI